MTECNFIVIPPAFYYYNSSYLYYYFSNSFTFYRDVMIAIYPQNPNPFYWLYIYGDFGS